MLRVLLSLSILTIGACSVLFSGEEGSVVATDAPPADASGFEVSAVEILPDYADIVPTSIPAQLFEGVGDGGGAPALLLLRGALIPADLSASFDFGNCTDDLDDYEVRGITVSTDQTMAVLEIAVTVSPNLKRDCMARLVLQGTGIDQLSEATTEVLDSGIMLVGLPELTDSSLPASTDQFAPLYSSIRIDLEAIFQGTVAARLNSISNIILAERISVVGGPGVNAGPGGCLGGTAAGAVCLSDGARPTTKMYGGAGGGHALQGGTNDGAVGGLATGDEYFSGGLSGGGGGGAGFDASLGGGGGGAISVIARGNIDLSDGVIRANGGSGQSESAGSGGGGGGGGGILVRSPVGIKSSSMTNIVAGGGSGGQAPDGSSGTGGKGSDGRIRIDAPVITEPFTILPLAQRGPLLAVPEERVLRSEEIELLVFGEGSFTDLQISVNEVELSFDVNFGGLPSKTLPAVDLQPGLNEVCAYPSGGEGSKVGKTCIEVAYLP